MWKPRLLTTIWAAKACYGDEFTFSFFIAIIIIILLHIIVLINYVYVTFLTLDITSDFYIVAMFGVINA
jgi:hypothetical protein